MRRRPNQRHLLFEEFSLPTTTINTKTYCLHGKINSITAAGITESLQTIDNLQVVPDCEPACQYERRHFNRARPQEAPTIVRGFLSMMDFYNAYTADPSLLDLDPDYQREQVWTNDQQSEFIETIIE